MRFITDFKVSGEELKYTPNPVIEHRKSCAEDILGNDISNAFSFKELGTIEESGLAGLYQTLEIEAFPMDKWESFKRNILYYTERCEYKHLILLLFEELESFGKPAGDTITNQQLNK